MLRDRLTTELRTKFGNAVRFQPDSDEFAIFDAKFPDLPNLIVEDNDPEAIVWLGEINHSHFLIYEEGLTEDERQTALVSEVVEFITDMLDDKYVIRLSGYGGGWCHIDYFDLSEMQSSGDRYFVWSGPFEPGETKSSNV